MLLGQASGSWRVGWIVFLLRRMILLGGGVPVVRRLVEM